MTVEQLINRLQREINVVVSLQDITTKNADRNSRLGLREAVAFESGLVAGYEYMRSCLASVILDFDVSELPTDG